MPEQSAPAGLAATTHKDLRLVEFKLTHLKELLIEEIKIHQALKSDLQSEAEQDGKLDGAALIHLQREKNQKAREIQVMESQRIQLVEEIAAGWSLPPKELTLRRIIPRTPKPLDEQLAACHRQLVALVEEIRALARETSRNAQARLKAVDATLSVIGEVAKLHPTYSEEGRLQKVTPTFKETSA